MKKISIALCALALISLPVIAPSIGYAVLQDEHPADYPTRGATSGSASLQNTDTSNIGNTTGNSTTQTADKPSRGGVPSAGVKDELKVLNPLRVNNIVDLIFLLADVALQIGAVVAVLALIYTGFKFVTASGSDKAIGEAKQMFYWNIIGIAVLFGATLIASIIQETIMSLRNY